MIFDWLDISIPLKNGLPPWPGDLPFSRTVVSEIGRDGSACEVSVLSMCAHSGTHVDAPRHFVAGGAGVDGIAVDLLIGPCYVLNLSGPQGHIGVRDIAGRVPAGTVRLLIKTRAAADGAFHEDFRALTQEAAGFLAENGVRLLGIDAPSIAPYSDLAGAHRAFLGAPGTAALENVDLCRAREGWYDLICLPLPVAFGDGAPARALIREREAGPNVGE
jgi:arylformamidase